MPIAKLLVGLAALVAGRQLYWLFVGVAGFILGAEMAARGFAQSPDWLRLVLALVIGLLGTFLAVLFQYVAAAIAGFLVAGYVALRVLDAAGVSGPGLVWIVFAAAGLAGFLLVLALFDWALIVLSSLAGAALVVEAVRLGPPAATGLFLALAVAGIVVQGAWLRARPPAPPRRRRSA
jgi:hypothetical protein